MFKKNELLHLKDKVSICLRKKITSSTQATADEVLNDSYINNLLQHDDGYKLLEKLPTSPAYWKKEGKELKATIRQLGMQTFFLTFSSAETKWGELLVILKKISDGVDISIEEALNLPFKEKANLIRNDPVTCARYFDNRMKSIICVMKSKNGCFKKHKLLHYYWRMEVQQRGSLHLHGLFWLENAPIFDKNNSSNLSDITLFINNYITTDIDTLNDELGKLQIHNHTKSCLRKLNNTEYCRFNHPKTPMKETVILFPLEE